MNIKFYCSISISFSNMDSENLRREELKSSRLLR
jgi:hypothetical protein